MNRILTIFILSALTTVAWAQDQPDYRDAFPSPYNEYVTFNIGIRYGVVLPMGGQKEYINQVSPANVALEGEWLFPRRFALGLKTGYQYNQQRRPRQVYTFTDGDIIQDVSAVQTRTLTIIPAMASVSYYFADNAAAIRPYVQLAGGGAFVNYTTFFGPLNRQRSEFKTAIAPAIGLKYYGQREKGFGAEIQAQYQNVFFSYEQLRNSAPSLMLSAGIVYRWY